MPPGFVALYRFVDLPLVLVIRGRARHDRWRRRDLPPMRVRERARRPVLRLVRRVPGVGGRAGRRGPRHGGPVRRGLADGRLADGRGARHGTRGRARPGVAGRPDDRRPDPGGRRSRRVRRRRPRPMPRLRHREPERRAPSASRAAPRSRRRRGSPSPRAEAIAAAVAAVPASRTSAVPPGTARGGRRAEAPKSRGIAGWIIGMVALGVIVGVIAGRQRAAPRPGPRDRGIRRARSSGRWRPLRRGGCRRRPGDRPASRRASAAPGQARAHGRDRLVGRRRPGQVPARDGDRRGPQDLLAGGQRDREGPVDRGRVRAGPRGLAGRAQQRLRRLHGALQGQPPAQKIADLGQRRAPKAVSRLKDTAKAQTIDLGEISGRHDRCGSPSCPRTRRSRRPSPGPRSTTPP